jgi:hypothetical protein
MRRLPNDPDAFMPQRSEEGSSNREVGDSLPRICFDDFDRSEVMACGNGARGVQAQAVVQQLADKMKATLQANLPTGLSLRAEGSSAPPRASLIVTPQVCLSCLVGLRCCSDRYASVPFSNSIFDDQHSFVFLLGPPIKMMGCQATRTPDPTSPGFVVCPKQ